MTFLLVNLKMNSRILIVLLVLTRIYFSDIYSYLGNMNPAFRVLMGPMRISKASQNPNRLHVNTGTLLQVSFKTILGLVTKIFCSNKNNEITDNLRNYYHRP